MKQLEEIFPLTLPDEMNRYKYDVYLLLLYNDFNISVEEAISRIREKQKMDREIQEWLF